MCCVVLPKLHTRKADIREKISEKLYNGLIRPDEVFVSDGAKCDIGRLQMMFGPGVTSAVQVRASMISYEEA